MASELEKSKYSDDAEKLKHISILDVRNVLLEEEVSVEADGGDIVNNIHGRLEEITFVGAGNESETGENVLIIFFYSYLK